MIGDAFATDTRGADVQTSALPAIWESPDDFAAKTADLEAAASNYALAAAEGQGPARQAFVKIGGTCKGCHEGYKAED